MIRYLNNKLLFLPGLRLLCMEPMPQPTFGKVIYTNRAYFIPFRTIFKGWNDFIVDNIHTNGNDTTQFLQMTPYTTIGDLAKTVIYYSDNGSSSDYHFSYEDQNSTFHYYKFSNYSKLVYKILVQLYGKFPLNPELTKQISALPILAAAKVYLDYYYNNAYINDSIYLTLNKLIHRDDGTLYYSDSQVTGIISCITNTYYDSDFFISCWDKPNTPNLTNQQSIFELKDPNEYNMYAASSNAINGGNWANANNQELKDPIISTERTVSGTTAPNRSIQMVTEFTINALKGLTSYLKRHQLAGGQTLTRYLARFGVTLTDEQLQRSKELGKQSWIMEVNPIFSNSDTAAAGGENLGQYAGAGYAESNDENYEIETNEYGILLGITTIKPKIINCDGMDGQVFNLTKLDFWTPEFDNMGVEPILAIELVNSNKGTDPTNTKAIENQIFGYLPRYARWKQLRDRMSGDICVSPYENQELGYFFNRVIDKTKAVNLYVHSKAFTQGDAAQFNRIFYGGTETKLHKDFFRLYHQFELIGNSNMKPMYDVYDWEHEGGKDIEVKNNGAIRN